MDLWCLFSSLDNLVILLSRIIRMLQSHLIVALYRRSSRFFFTVSFFSVTLILATLNVKNYCFVWRSTQRIAWLCGFQPSGCHTVWICWHVKNWIDVQRKNDAITFHTHTNFRFSFRLRLAFFFLLLLWKAAVSGLSGRCQSIAT